MEGEGERQRGGERARERERGERGRQTEKCEKKKQKKKKQEKIQSIKKIDRKIFTYHHNFSKRILYFLIDL